MTTPKFKIGDRVKFKDVEGRACVGLISSFYQYDCDNWRYVLEGNGVLSWHESHLSLDVPGPKKYATDREVGLGVEIIDLIKKCSSQAKSIEHLSNRLTEEIGGRARERIAREASDKQLLHASDLLICETESFSKERRLREAVQGDNRRLIDSKMTLLQEVAIERTAKEAAQKELADVRKDLADIRIISKRLAL